MRAKMRKVAGNAPCIPSLCGRRPRRLARGAPSRLVEQICVRDNGGAQPLQGAGCGAVHVCPTAVYHYRSSHGFYVGAQP